jgi:hypothetical protein
MAFSCGARSTFTTEGNKLLEKHAIAPSAARLCWIAPLAEMHIINEMGIFGEILGSHLSDDYCSYHRRSLLSGPSPLFSFEDMRAMHAQMLGNVAKTLVSGPKLSLKPTGTNCADITYGKCY